MEKLPKLKEFKEPEGYFDQLPDQIMASIKPNKRNTWIRYAASIALIISTGLWIVYAPSEEVQQLSLEEEVNLYIDSQYWTAEDVLSMAENPDEILDQIINEEFPEGTELWGEEEQTWF
jgi:hypothetical protein